MMKRLLSLLVVLLREFGGLVVFWTLLNLFGLKVAIGGTLLFVIVDGGRRIWLHLPMNRVWIMSSGLALVFGIVDLVSVSPFMIRYEAMVTNVIVGVFFFIGSFGAKPMIQEIAEERQGFAFEQGRPDLRAFFRAFTLVWAAYFFLKAAAYFWIARHVGFEDGMIIRVICGSVSFYVMVLISTQGRSIYFLCRKMGMFRNLIGAREDIAP